MRDLISLMRMLPMPSTATSAKTGAQMAAGCRAAPAGNRIGQPLTFANQSRGMASPTKGAAAVKKAPSKKAPAAPPVAPIPQLPVPAETAPELVNMGILRTLDLEHRIRFDTDGRSLLFARRHPGAIRAGSMVAVETAASVSQPNRSIIIGYIVAIRRKGGMGSNFVVRTTIMGVGVEMMFPVYSPLVTKITVLQRSNDFQRSKLHYLKSAKAGSLASEMFKKMDQRVEDAKKKFILSDRTMINLVK